MDKEFTQATLKADSDGFTAVASSEVQDRHGEVIEQGGWDLKNYKANPILLWMHDASMPLGKATRVWVDKTGAKPLLKFKGVISTATDYGKAAKQLIEEGILNSFSVGLKIVDMDQNTITKAELLEISLVSIPANPEARLLAYKSLEASGFKQKVIDKVVDDAFTKKLVEMDKRLTENEEKVNLAVNGLKHLNPQDGRSRTVLTDRQNYSKIIAKTADKLLAGKPTGRDGMYVKIIKQSSELLIRSHKEELNGKNQGTAPKA